MGLRYDDITKELNCTSYDATLAYANAKIRQVKLTHFSILGALAKHSPPVSTNSQSQIKFHSKRSSVTNS